MRYSCAQAPRSMRNVANHRPWFGFANHRVFHILGEPSLYSRSKSLLNFGVLWRVVAFLLWDPNTTCRIWIKLEHLQRSIKGAEVFVIPFSHTVIDGFKRMRIEALSSTFNGIIQELKKDHQTIISWVSYFEYQLLIPK
jgi:hypothetical protein